MMSSTSHIIDESSTILSVNNDIDLRNINIIDMTQMSDRSINRTFKFDDSQHNCSRPDPRIQVLLLLMYILLYCIIRYYYNFVFFSLITNIIKWYFYGFVGLIDRTRKSEHFHSSHQQIRSRTRRKSQFHSLLLITYLYR
jgi:hypothetical protein